MNIQIVEERDGEVPVLLPVGRIDGGNAYTFESTIMDLINGGKRQVVVDCSRLDFISSAGLRVLLVAARALRKTSGTLVLCAMNDNVDKVVRTGGFDRIVPIAASREAALEAADAPMPGGPLRQR